MRLNKPKAKPKKIRHLKMGIWDVAAIWKMDDDWLLTILLPGIRYIGKFYETEAEAVEAGNRVIEYWKGKANVA